MLIPIIKDLNNTFSYLVLNSTEKAKGIVDSVSWIPSTSVGSDGTQRLVERKAGWVPHEIFQIGWATVQIFFSFLVKAIQYIVSFQWLRDFAYLPISIPASTARSDEGNLEDFYHNIISLARDGPTILQRFLTSNEVTSHFVMGSPTTNSVGAPINSWSLSFLSNEWFDPLTVPVNFISTLSEPLAKNISSLPSMTTNGDIPISNLIIMSILLCASSCFSSFFNSFFISLPLSLSNVLSLRYLIVQKFWAGCFSILGIVLGEICFMLFLILPPPFIQITLIYLESVWPYIFGLSLIIFIIFDYICNPYPNTVSFSSLITSLRKKNSGNSGFTPYQIFWQRPLTDARVEGGFLGRIVMAGSWIKTSINPWFIKIFGWSFLLAFTEQSCCFAFFGSLNMSSTANFLDTYLFAASSSPVILFFSCLGFFNWKFFSIINL